MKKLDTHDVSEIVGLLIRLPRKHKDLKERHFTQQKLDIDE